MRIPTMLLAVAVLIVSGLTAISASANSVPKTVFQCKKHFKPGAKRAACIKRVQAAKPGASCAHPLVSGLSQTQEPGGDQRDMPIELAGLPNREPEAKYFFGKERLNPPYVVATYYLARYSFGPKVKPCRAKMRVLNVEIGEKKYLSIPIPPPGHEEHFVVAVVAPFDIGIELEATRAG